MKKQNNFTYASGKRKTASARVRLIKGKGDSTVNGKLFTEYFSDVPKHKNFEESFKATDTLGKYYVTVKVLGGGKKGQLDATFQGIGKALALLNPDSKLVLRKLGFITRDPRERERRKVGTGGKARRVKQSPKR